MADRLMLITHLKTNAEQAAQRGDDRAAALFDAAAQMLYEDGVAAAALAARRNADADRQDRRRRRKEAENVTLGHVTSRDTRDGSFPSPTPPSLSPTPQHNTARDPVDGRDVIVEQLIGLLSERMGALWPDVDAFLKRREYTTWKGWLSEMLAATTGGSAKPEDLAQVCRDDTTLARPVGSAKGLRVFIRSAIDERRGIGQTPSSGSPRSLPNRRPANPQVYDYQPTEDAPKWQTPLKRA